MLFFAVTPTAWRSAELIGEDAMSADGDFEIAHGRRRGSDVCVVDVRGTARHAAISLDAATGWCRAQVTAPTVVACG